MRPRLPTRPFPAIALAFAALGVGAAPASAQVIDLDAKLAALVGRLGSTPVTAPLSDQVTALGDVTTGLIGPGGVLTDIEAEIGRQGDLLDLRAGDILSLRADLGDLRSVVTGGTNLTDLRSSVNTLSTDLRSTNQRVAEHDRDIAAMKATSAMLDRSVQRHDGQFDAHEQRMDAQTSWLQEHDGQMAAMGRQMAGTDQALAAYGQTLAGHGQTLAAHGQTLAAHGQTLAAHDRTLAAHGQTLVEHGAAIADLGGRIDVANQGVAMALAMKAPALGDTKSFALSGGWGTFEGQNAFAVSGAMRAGDNVQLDGGLAVGAENASVGGRAGANISW